jgi:hypothetical protein
MKNIIVCLMCFLSFAVKAQISSEETRIEVVSFNNERLSILKPAGFILGYRQQTPNAFIVELVPQGQSVHNWQKMITLTGNRSSGASIEGALDFVGGKYKNACPTTYSSKGLGFTPSSSARGWVSCGNTGQNSEQALIVMIQGEGAIYSVQWAERGLKQEQKMMLDEQKWMNKMIALKMNLSPQSSK